MRLTILGASGHGKVIADIAERMGYDEIEFLDDDESIAACGKYPVVGKCGDAVYKTNDVIVAIGSVAHRKRILEGLRNVPILVHPNAVIAEGTKLGEGNRMSCDGSLYFKAGYVLRIKAS